MAIANGFSLAYNSFTLMREHWRPHSKSTEIKTAKTDQLTKERKEL